MVGSEGEVVITQDLLTYEIQGEDETGRLKGKHVGTGIVRPNFWERARYYNIERELAEAQAQPAAGGSFLGSMFGGGARAPGPAPQPQASPWGSQRGGSVPSVSPQQSGGWGAQAMQQQAPQGGSFLKNALGTAAGVAGGMMLANSLSGLFSGHHNAHGIAGDTAGGTGAGAGAASSLASHDDSAIAGGIFDNKTSDRSAEPAPQQASYDDGGGWGSGGDDSSDA